MKNITIEDLKAIIDLMESYNGVLISDYNDTLDNEELFLLHKLKEIYNETN